MELTKEQEAIVQKIQEPECTLLKVNSVAGSGKTSILVEISKMLNPKNGLYLAYNKAIATEAGTKFSTGTHCMTTHSLAYKNTVAAFGLRVGFFNYKDIKDRIPYETKIMVLELFNEFCLSEYSKFDEYVEAKKLEVLNVHISIFDIVRKYFVKMSQGEIAITHNAYLKLYHLLLHNKKIVHNEFDLLMLDEAGDLNPVTLEIFRLIPAKKKLLVGDENQNIYTFNNTINGFKSMRNEGIQLNMTQSFRCSVDIAKRIEAYCRLHLDGNMQFRGVEQTNKYAVTESFISRNNSTLVGEMIGYIKSDIPYNLTRPSKAIFELILILLNLKPGGKIFSGEWKFLQEDVDMWDQDMFLHQQYQTPLKYIASLYGEDQSISSAMNVIATYGPGSIFSAYDNAQRHEKEKGHNHTLCTAHSSKGLEFDKVTIGDDLNLSVGKVLAKDRDEYSETDFETLRLYYVACSRALIQLNNADHLPTLKEINGE